MRDARASDDRRRRGVPKGPLDGIPVSIKANISVREYSLTAGSRLLKSDNSTDGCGYDNDVAQRLLRECGAVLIGITNMDEFGMGSLGANAPLIAKIGNMHSYYYKHKCTARKILPSVKNTCSNSNILKEPKLFGSPMLFHCSSQTQIV